MVLDLQSLYHICTAVLIKSRYSTAISAITEGRLVHLVTLTQPIQSHRNAHQPIYMLDKLKLLVASLISASQYPSTLNGTFSPLRRPFTLPPTLSRISCGVSGTPTVDFFFLPTKSVVGSCRNVYSTVMRVSLFCRSKPYVSSLDRRKGPS